ncbi:hypothetical protein QD763_003938 [Salmonella enterica]|nr:hypothetical protein [Salmonella enterica]EJF5594631.1 hypothetical protein [Salmonella enterica]EJF5825796.1 hypothetical protein [Salmonella enterica]EJF5844508.1 hypothetical protein [Salmonella enterica]EJF5916985.1 hypothetical protein [Salmonella enterica]
MTSWSDRRYGEYLAENASLWDVRNLTDRLIAATERLVDYPRLYETDECYGEGVLGQHVLYEVNDEARRVNIILASCIATENSSSGKVSC